MAEQAQRGATRRIVIAGASGMIGHALAERLTASGDEVVRLVRRRADADRSAGGRAGEALWDPAAGVLDPAVVCGTDAVVNLSGASTGRLPWTSAYKKVIVTSRLDATRTLVDAIHAAADPPAVFVSASAVGIYGNRGNEELTETSVAGTGYLSAVCRAWERAANEASDVTRVVAIRTGLVVGRGPAMQRLRMLSLAGVAGPLGTGRQWWPWISLRDEVAAIDHIIGPGRGSANGRTLSGPVNLAGPLPATQARFSRTLAKRLHRPYGMPVPAFALRLALRDAADDLLLGSQRVVPAALLSDGFRFTDDTVDSAIGHFVDELG